MITTLLLLLLLNPVHAMCAIRVYGPDGGCSPGTRVVCTDVSRCVRRCECDAQPVPVPLTIITDQGGVVVNNMTRAEYYNVLLAKRQPLTPGFMDVTRLLDPLKNVDGLRGMYRFDHADLGSPMSNIPLTQGERVSVALTTLVNRKRVEYHQDRIATRVGYRYAYSSAGIAASTFVRDMLTDACRDSQVLHTVTMVKGSVILSIPGTPPRADEMVIVSAHVDTRNVAGGGFDNVNGAAGMAAAMEACLAILDGGEQPLRTVECHFYAGHHVGLTGSSGIAEVYSGEAKQVVGVYNLDGIAYNSTDGYVYLIDSWSDMTDSVATQFVASLMNAYAPTLVPVRIACGFACSDHTSWGRVGYPATTVANALNHSVVVSSTSQTIFEHAKVAVAFAIELAYK